jgi:hypothetical protein
MRRSNVAFLALLSPLLGDGMERTPSSNVRITVGSNVQVSRVDSKRPHEEMLAAAHPSDPNQLVAGVMVGDTKQNGIETVWYHSADGGRRWTRTRIDVRPDYTNVAGDPAVTYGRGDTVYSATLPGNISIFRSIDGGKTWEPPTIIPFIDREYLDVDRTGAYPGRVYLYANGDWKDSAGKGGPQMQLLRSLDAGKTFIGPTALPDYRDYSSSMPSRGVVLEDGTLLIPIRATKPGMARDSGLLQVAISTDGGETLEPPVLIARASSNSRLYTGTFMQLAVDRSNGPYRGRVYAVYANYEGSRGVVRVTHSDDKGRTWSTGILASDAPARSGGKIGADAYYPVIAVNNTGAVGISWYDRREAPDDLGYRARFAASLDGGVSFEPSIAIATGRTTHPVDEQYFPYATTRPGKSGDATEFLIFPPPWLHITPGDTREMVTTADGTFHPFWTDNRTGIYQLWTARVTVHGEAIRNGAKELANLTDVTPLTDLRFRNVRYDRFAHVVKVDAMVHNRSKQTVYGPFKTRVVSLDSPWGIIEIEGATNGVRGRGAILNLGGSGSDRVLLPDSLAKPVTLTFSVRNPKPVGLGVKIPFWPELINSTIFIYGHSK